MNIPLTWREPVSWTWRHFGNFSRPVVSRHLKSLETYRNAQVRVRSTWKPLESPAKASVEIHKRMCLSQARKQKLPCVVSILCRKLTPQAWGTSGSLCQTRVTSDKQWLLSVSPQTCTYLWYRHRPPNLEPMNNFPQQSDGLRTETPSRSFSSCVLVLNAMVTL